MKPGQRKWRSCRVIVSWDAWMFDDFDVRWSMNSSWVPHTTCIVLQSFRSWPRSWGNLWTSKAPDRPLWCRDYCRMSWSILHYYSGKNIQVILIGLHTWFSVHRTVHMCTIYIFFAHILCTFLDGSCFCELQITGKDAPDSQETVWQEFWRQRDAACKVHLCVHCF